MAAARANREMMAGRGRGENSASRREFMVQRLLGQRTKRSINTLSIFTFNQVLSKTCHSLSHVVRCCTFRTYCSCSYKVQTVACSKHQMNLLVHTSAVIKRPVVQKSMLLANCKSQPVHKKILPFDILNPI